MSTISSEHAQRLSFSQSLRHHGLELRRAKASTLQINVGYCCNQFCKHCHLEAGPHRREIMTPAIMSDAAAFAKRFSFAAIDITGGAPELVPGIDTLLMTLAGLAPSLLIRTNLTALFEGREYLIEIYRKVGATVIASLPAVNAGQTEAQRGEKIWEKSIATLSLLNRAGFGLPGSGLLLHLVANPAGAFLPPAQCGAEKKFKSDLRDRYGIDFTSLYTFANVPLGRFRKWLDATGNTTSYLDRLVANFNPTTIDGLMCRHLISLSPAGFLYDCDFNQAAGLPLGGERVYVADVREVPIDIPVMIGDHCYACAAGPGFT